MRRMLGALLLFVYLCAMDAQAADGDAFASGNAEYAAGRFKEAAELYERALVTGETSTSIFYNLANAHYRTGDFGRAILNYERALAMEPRQPEATANLRLARDKARALELRESWWATRVSRATHHPLRGDCSDRILGRRVRGSSVVPKAPAVCDVDHSLRVGVVDLRHRRELHLRARDGHARAWPGHRRRQKGRCAARYGRQRKHHPHASRRQRNQDPEHTRRLDLRCAAQRSAGLDSSRLRRARAIVVLRAAASVAFRAEQNGVEESHSTAVQLCHGMSRHDAVFKPGSRV